MTDENAFKRVTWNDEHNPSDDDDEYGMPLRAPGDAISAEDMDLLTLAARAIGAVQVEPIEGEQWVNLHFEDGRIVYGWNPLVFSGDALELAVRLELDVMHRVVGGKRVEILPAGGPITKEFDRGDALVTTRRAITRAAADIGKAM